MPRCWRSIVLVGMPMISALLVSSAPVQAQQSPAGKRYALLVGVQAYQHVKLREPNPLKYAVADVNELARVLKKSGYVVTLLTDETGRGDARLEPTRDNIERELQSLSQKVKEHDTLLVGLAGHGLQFTGKKDAYFCPIDARPFENQAFSLVSISKVYEQLDQSFAGVKVVLVDACRNDPDPTRGRGLDADAAPPPPKGVAVLFSCSAGEKALENDALQHGVFFHYVLEGLEGKAGDEAGEVTFEDLSKYVRKRVPAKVRELTEGRMRQSPNAKSDLAGEPPVLARISIPAAKPPRPAPDSPPSTGSTPSGSTAPGGKKITNRLGMELLLIPAGKFRMGSPASEKDLQENENPVEVTLTKAFYMGKTEVTQGEWRAVMGTEPWKGKTDVREGNNYAASYVSWEDAQEFCQKLSEKETGTTYRLPTEAEWEYACRAGTSTQFSFGDEKSRLGDYAWYGGIEQERYAHQVATRKPNPWGLHDMHGNMWEWCQDWFAEKLPGGTDPRVTAEGSLRVYRGGGWNGGAAYCRSADRGADSPSTRGDSLGFRVARMWPVG
jgi:formylglycine-generating enzyme required for sulfatase activity